MANDRHGYRRELKRIIGNLDWALIHLQKVGEAYKEHHPEITEVCEVVAVGCMTIQETVRTLREQI